MDPLVKSFEEWLMEERAPKTIESYIGDVKGFQQYLADKDVEKTQYLSRFAFVQYRKQLINEGYSMSTINKKINSLKVYNDYLCHIGYLDEIVICLKKDQVKVSSGSKAIVTALLYIAIEF